MFVFINYFIIIIIARLHFIKIIKVVIELMNFHYFILKMEIMVRYCN